MIPFWLCGLFWCAAGVSVWWAGVLPRGRAAIMALVKLAIGIVFILSSFSPESGVRDLLRNMVAGYALVQTILWIEQGIRIRRAIRKASK